MTESEPTQASHVILMRMPETRGSGQDKDQPLSRAGRAAALAAAQDMYGAGHHPGPLLASNTPAGRETAAILAGVVHPVAGDLHFSDDLYAATTDTLEVEIRAVAEAYTLPTVIAWDPGVSEMVRILSRDPQTPPLQPAQWRYLPWPPLY